MSPLMMPRPRPLLLELLVMVVVSAVMAVDQRSCHFQPVAEERLPTKGPATVLHGVRSLAHCSLACMTSLGAGCLSLGYSQEQRECRGYSVFNASDVTVASPGHKYYRGCPACPYGYGDKYNKTNDWVVYKNDAYTQPGTSESACKTICTSDPLCRSFDWNGFTCYIQYLIKNDVLEDYHPGSGWSYFERLCA